MHVHDFRTKDPKFGRWSFQQGKELYQTFLTGQNTQRRGVGLNEERLNEQHLGFYTQKTKNKKQANNILTN